MTGYMAAVVIAAGIGVLSAGLWLLDRWWTAERMARAARENLRRQLPPVGGSRSWR